MRFAFFFVGFLQIHGCVMRSARETGGNIRRTACKKASAREENALSCEPADVERIALKSVIYLLVLAKGHALVPGTGTCTYHFPDPPTEACISRVKNSSCPSKPYVTPDRELPISARCHVCDCWTGTIFGNEWTRV
jgi:hypothetical protein